jgi:hypothetical protein
VGEKVVAGHVGAVGLGCRCKLRLLRELPQPARGALDVDESDHLTLEIGVA